MRGEGSAPGYPLPTAGIAHPGIFVEDTRRYWYRVRKLGSIVVRARSPELRENQALALIGQLNLGVGQFGRASEAASEPIYNRWVPDILLDFLRPRFVIL